MREDPQRGIRSTHLDGTPIFKTAEDEKNERTVSHDLEVAWRCTLHTFGALSPIDWFAERDGRMVAVLELKARTHSSSTFSTVFLSVRKWLALTLAEAGLGVPAVFVVKFTDDVLWVPLSDIEIDASRLKIGGWRSSLVKSRNDVEPIIEVNVSDMRTLISEKETNTAQTGVA